jgi:ABC-type glycerol-3-phosphate transport system permease component
LNKWFTKKNINTFFQAIPILILVILISSPSFKMFRIINRPDVFSSLSSSLNWAIPTFWGNMLNTIRITLLRCLLVFVVSMMGGYALAKFEFPFKRLIFSLVIFSMVIPDFLIIIPLFKIVSFLNWTNTVWGLVIPAAGNGLGIFLIRQYMVNNLTDDLIHAAMIDGASQMSILFRIVTPIVKPAVVILLVKTGIDAWNEYLKPMIFLSQRAKMTLQVVIDFTFNQNQFFPAFMALYIGLIPLLLLFLFFSKQLISNITAGSIKY